MIYFHTKILNIRSTYQEYGRNKANLQLGLEKGLGDHEGIL